MSGKTRHVTTLTIIKKTTQMKKIYLLTLILLLSINIGFCQTTKDILNVTNEFIGTLNQEDKQSILLEFKDSLRTKWTNLPVGLAKRQGKKIGDLSAESRVKFHHILTTLFSSQGYLKTTSIMNLDDVLNEVYKTLYETKSITNETYAEIKALDWDYNNYYIAIWGKPNLTEPWGLKFEGHHISINLSVVGEKYSLTPLFLGTDPAEVSITKHAGLRVLSKEEDYGLLLINSLTAAQKKTATLSQEVPGDIITNPANTQRILEYQGIKGADLTENQKGVLELLITEYIHNLEYHKAKEYFEKIKKSGFDAIYFAWIGSYERHHPNYYIINGPDFIIEYDNVGFQNDGNHIHSIWREKQN